MKLNINMCNIYVIYNRAEIIKWNVSNSRNVGCAAQKTSS